VARDWNNETETLSALEARVASLAPGNTAPIPIDASKQRNELTGEWTWVVDIHVRIPRVTEFELTGSDTTLTGAIRRAYLALNSHKRLRRQASDANLAFGIAV
jgi:hypothetical protein